MNKRYIFLVSMFFAQIIISSAVEIEQVPVVQQWSLDCGAHALKNAVLGLELLENEDPDQEQMIRDRMLNYGEYKSFSSFMSRKISLNNFQLNGYIQQLGVANVFVFMPRSFSNMNTLRFWYHFGGVLGELVESNYIKSFLIPSGTRHIISCTIKKVNGQVVEAISMDSLRSRYFKVFNKVISFVTKSEPLTEQSSTQRVVDLANSADLVEQVRVYNLYKRCLEMAECMSRSFYVTELTGDYIIQQYDQERELSQDLIDDWARRFRDYVQTLSLDENSGERVSNHDFSRELSRVQFLETFASDSVWWTDASMFGDENQPPQFSDEQRSQMIELLNINGLLAGNSSEVEVSNEDNNSGSEESLEESKGE